MPEGQVFNAGLAYNSAGQDNVVPPQAHVVYAVSGGTITNGQGVYFTYSTATGIITATAASTANAASPGGFAQAACTTVGVIIPVATEGLALIQYGAALANGNAFSIGATGWAATASTVIGSNWGIALVAGATGGSVYWAQVQRM